MISIEASRSGHPVFLKDGRYLASSIDPIAEAVKWRAAAQEFLGDVRVAVVLGLGCGYHVVELLKSVPDLRVVVVESDEKVAREARVLWPGIPEHVLLVESDWSRLLEHEHVMALTHAPFRLLKHVPSCQSDELFYRRAEALILARDRTGFFLQLRDRPQLLRSLQRDKLEALPTGPISIKTVLSVLRPDGKDKQEALLWKMLGELVR